MWKTHARQQRKERWQQRWIDVCVRRRVVQCCRERNSVGRRENGGADPTMTEKCCASHAICDHLLSVRIFVLCLHAENGSCVVSPRNPYIRKEKHLNPANYNTTHAHKHTRQDSYMSRHTIIDVYLCASPLGASLGRRSYANVAFGEHSDTDARSQICYDEYHWYPSIRR